MESEKPFVRLAEIYDELMEEEFYRRMVGYLERVFERYSIRPGRALDLACGTGRFSIYLAKKGWAVTGLDISGQMLSVARRRTKDAGLNIKFIRGDMVNLKADEGYDLATCFYDSINYILDETKLSKFFKRVKKALSPAGYFVFDINTLRGLRDYWDTNLRRRIFPSGESLWMTRWDEDTNINTLKVTASFKGKNCSFKRLTEVHRERGYPNETVADLLEKAGFRSVDVFECFSFAPDDGAAGKVAVIAK